MEFERGPECPSEGESWESVDGALRCPGCGQRAWLIMKRLPVRLAPGRWSEPVPAHDVLLMTMMPEAARPVAGVVDVVQDL